LRLAGVVNANRPPPIFPFAPLSAPLAPLPAGIWRCRSLSAYTMVSHGRRGVGERERRAEEVEDRSGERGARSRLGFLSLCCVLNTDCT